MSDNNTKPPQTAPSVIKPSQTEPTPPAPQTKALNHAHGLRDFNIITNEPSDTHSRSNSRDNNFNRTFQAKRKPLMDLYHLYNSIPLCNLKILILGKSGI